MFAASVAFAKKSSLEYFIVLLCAVQKYRLLPVKIIPFLIILKHYHLFTVMYHNYILTV